MVDPRYDPRYGFDFICHLQNPMVDPRYICHLQNPMVDPTYRRVRFVIQVPTCYYWVLVLHVCYM